MEFKVGDKAIFTCEEEAYLKYSGTVVPVCDVYHDQRFKYNITTFDGSRVTAMAEELSPVGIEVL